MCKQRREEIQEQDPGIMRRSSPRGRGSQMWCLGIKVEKKPNKGRKGECGEHDLCVGIVGSPGTLTRPVPVACRR